MADFVLGDVLCAPAAPPALGEMLGAARAAPPALGEMLGGGGRARAARGGDRARGALAMVSTRADECDCVLGAAPAGEGVCATAEIVDRVAKFAAVPAENPAEVIDAASKKLACGSEGCVLRHAAVLSFVRNTEGPTAAKEFERAAQMQLKTPGPRYGNALLSNHHIDDVLSRWAVEFPAFFNCPFAMFDFDRVSGYRLSEVDLEHVAAGREEQVLFGGTRARRPCDTFACVLNTDVSSGRGKHWVCVFADMRGDATVEYFNSSGRPPPAAVTRWMERQAATLRRGGRAASTAVVCSVTHQRSRTECGLYALFYIRARLEGQPWQQFSSRRVPDADMEQFRQHVFSDKK